MELRSSQTSRSQPFSRYNPQFNRDALRSALLESGTQYAFLGAELGGRPPEPEFYDSEGHVLYGAVVKAERFNSGLQRLLKGSDGYRVVMLCSEEDPTHCHRRLLVGRVLAEQEISVAHIRGDGSVVHDEHLDAPLQQGTQGALFGQEVSPWRSIRSVSPSTPAQDFFESLKSAGVTRLIDVRLNNVSQLAGFAKRDDLRYFLNRICSADYVHEPLLAPNQPLLDAYRKHGSSWADYEIGFRQLMAERRIEERIPKELFEGIPVLLCSEYTAQHCHRRLVCDYLNEHWGGVETIHI